MKPRNCSLCGKSSTSGVVDGRIFVCFACVDSPSWGSFTGRILGRRKKSTTFGLEVEQEIKDSKTTRAVAIAHVYSKIYSMKGDGSLRCGIEFVSPPFTREYYFNEKKKIFGSIDITMLSWLFMRASTGGLHIHFKPIAPRRVVYDRIVYLAIENERLFDIVSGREDHRLEAWAIIPTKEKLNYFYEGDYGDTLLEGIISHSEKIHPLESKHQSINYHSEYQTIEIRLFSTTDSSFRLNVDIQFVIALAGFAENNEICSGYSEKFINYIKNDVELKELNTFIERFYES